MAVHALSILAIKEGPVTSADLAASIGTNAAFVRQILMQLKSANLVQARLGKAGGSFLACKACDLNLLNVYDAVQDTSQQLLAKAKSSPNPECVIGRHIVEALDGVTAPAEQAFRAELAATSVADVVADIQRRDPDGMADATC